MASLESSIEIHVVRFRPIGSVTTTTVVMELKNLKPDPNRPDIVTDGLSTLVGSYYIKVAKPEPASPEMRVRFSVKTHQENPFPNERYMLQGIAFSNRRLPSGDNQLGQRDFTNIQIAGQGDDRTFTITNSRAAGPVSYDYLFLIQRIQDGAIGIIDPEWENE